MTARKAHRRRGVAATELAILMPVFGFFVGVVADYSRLYYALATLSDTARAGAVYYATNYTTATVANVKAVAQGDATNLPTLPTITAATGTDSTGNIYVKVTASYTFTTLVPHPGIPSPIVLSRKVIMMVNP